MKRSISTILVLAMLCSVQLSTMQLSAFAAAPTSVSSEQQTAQDTKYSLKADKTTVQILSGDEVVKTCTLKKNSKLTLSKATEGGICVRWKDADTAKTHRYNLPKSQKQILLTGKLSDLVIDGKFPTDCSVVLDKEAALYSMTVHAPVNVSVSGKINTVDIQNKKARVKQERKGKIQTVYTVSDSAIDGVFSEHIQVYDEDGDTIWIED